MFNRRDALKMLGLPAVAQFGAVNSARAAAGTIYFDSAAPSGGNGTARAPYSDPSGLVIPVNCSAVYFRRGSDFRLKRPIGLAPGRTTPLVIGAWGNQRDPRPILRAGRVAVATDFIQVRIVSTSVGAYPSVTPDNASCLYQVVDPNGGGSPSGDYFRYWGAFGDGVFGIQQDTKGEGPDGTVHTPRAERQWGYCSGGYVLYSGNGNPAAAPNVPPYVSTYADSDLVSSQGAILDLASTPQPITISNLDFRDARIAVRYDLRFAPNVPPAAVPGFAVQNCRGSGLYYGIFLVGGSATPLWTDGNDFAGFVNLEVSGNFWQNLGNAWVLGDSTYIGFRNSSIHDNVWNKCCQAYSTGGVYANHWYGLAADQMHIYDNTGSQTGYGHFWPTDGYDFYTEVASANILWENNFSWGSQGAFIANSTLGGSGIHFRHCIAVNVGQQDMDAGGFNIADSAGLGSTMVEVDNCISQYYRYLLKSTEKSSAARVSVHDSYYLGVPAGGWNVGVTTGNPTPTSCYTVDGNGIVPPFKHAWWDYVTGTDLPTTGTSTDASLYACITDQINGLLGTSNGQMPAPAVNYAKQTTNIWTALSGKC
ncbi:MAG TPA: hypothetical protein VF457_05945 [Burkholderiaceae bacterium]